MYWPLPGREMPIGPPDGLNARDAMGTYAAAAGLLPNTHACVDASAAPAIIRKTRAARTKCFLIEVPSDEIVTSRGETFQVAAFSAVFLDTHMPIAAYT